MKQNRLLERITLNPKVMVGKPVIKGTRLDDERAPNKIDAVRRLVVGYADRLASQFVVVTETTVRFARQ